MDMVVHAHRFPSPGETILGTQFSTSPGGKGANQAVAIGRLGGNVAFVGRVGEDPFGEQLLASLRSANVDVQWTTKDVKVASGVAVITVSDSGENMIVVAPGANSTLTASAVKEAIDADQPQVVLAQLEIPVEAIEPCCRATLFVLNPAPARLVPPLVLASVDYLTPNETEAESLTGIQVNDDRSCLAAGNYLLDQGVQNVIITLGAKGCAWVRHEGLRHFPTHAVTPVDTTAAGDAFSGALAWFLADGRDPENAIALANVVAALCTTRAGAQTAMPSWEEVRAAAAHLA